MRGQMGQTGPWVAHLVGEAVEDERGRRLPVGVRVVGAALVQYALRDLLLQAAVSPVGAERARVAAGATDQRGRHHHVSAAGILLLEVVVSGGRVSGPKVPRGAATLALHCGCRY